jgi:hypothetical protein
LKQIDSTIDEKNSKIEPELLEKYKKLDMEEFEEDMMERQAALQNEVGSDPFPQVKLNLDMLERLKLLLPEVVQIQMTSQEQIVATEPNILRIEQENYYQEEVKILSVVNDFYKKISLFHLDMQDYRTISL